MKKIACVLIIIGLALLVSGFVKHSLAEERKAKIDRMIIHPALYGSDYLDWEEFLNGRFTWRHSKKIHAERIGEGKFKVYIPKAMYKVKARLAALEH